MKPHFQYPNIDIDLSFGIIDSFIRTDAVVFIYPPDEINAKMSYRQNVYYNVVLCWVDTNNIFAI